MTPTATTPASSSSSSSRLRRAVILSCFVCALFAVIELTNYANVAAAGDTKSIPRPKQSQATNETQSKRLGVRLRSFVPRASGALNFEPTETGGRVRLTALGLPMPSGVAQNATSYVVWAAAPGGARRVGTLQTDAAGNGGLEFERPAGLDSYSVLVTAEAASTAERPMGAVVFASRANEVTAFFATVDQRMTEAKRRTSASARRPDVEAPRGRLRRHNTGDFYAEVDEAVSVKGGGRVLELYGVEVTPNARGEAYTNVRGEQSYVRARIVQFPASTSVGAKAYVLWGIEPAGRIIYMGSVPELPANTADVYVRMGGAMANDMKLAVTAEDRNLVAAPSSRRAISSRPKR